AKEKVVGDLEGKFDGNLTEYDYYVLGHIYHLRWPRSDKSRQLTRAIWEQGLQHYPESPLLATKLAFSYGFDSPESKAVGEKAKKGKARPRLDEWYFHWAKAFACEAKYEQECAMKEARAAVAFAPYDALSHADLADVATTFGQLDEA